jgi:hypothetical protein
VDDLVRVGWSQSVVQGGDAAGSGCASPPAHSGRLS